ncbi:PhoPQ-activated protein PqaA family protein, partial [bacterium]|nr:PhoPQ-activated protein PqaA family protein [bacterium]
MTKSAVRAMDTVTDFMAKKPGGSVAVERFVVAGGSKRGWTTWTTGAVDKRVEAIIPIVIDMLNVVPSFEHHYRVYGFFAPAVGDYVSMGIMEWQNTPEYQRLIKVTEPYEYRERYTMPKFLINASGDQFFVPDSGQFYWSDLIGEKHVRYVPNAGHSLKGSDAVESLAAYYHSILARKSLPQFEWEISENGTITVSAKDKPAEVKLWQATNPNARDFRIDSLGPEWTSSKVEAGAKFPAKYQEALFINDWSYGKLYAVHLDPDGASYSASFEEFISGSPLPLTDIVVNPNDGALYFAIGGRRTKSGLYRVTYSGSESIASPKPNQRGANARSIRRKLESFHGKKDPNAVAAAWPYLGHSDRFLRYAARVALEHQDPQTWQSRVFTEGNHEALINGAIALARVGDASNRAPLLLTLNQILLDALDNDQIIRLTRAYGLIGMRLGRPTATESDTLIKRLDVLFPSEDRYLNAELCKLLVYLQSPNAASKGVSLLEGAPSQEEQIDYAMSLRHLKEGWNTDLRQRYFTWFNRARSYRGGASFKKFVDYIKDEALEQLPAEEKADIESLLANATPPASPLAAIGSRAFVKEWTLDELTPIVANGLQNRDFAKGRKLFGEVACFACHRFSNEGGALGPDLTGVAGRFSPRDLLESILDPNKEVSDQYAPIVVTTTEGEQVTGRIMNLAGDNLMINVNMFDPNEIESVDRTKVESIEPSKVSMMPEGLLHLLNKDEVLDLMAYLLSRGDSGHLMFKK